jgi:hypothetical protein
MPRTTTSISAQRVQTAPDRVLRSGVEIPDHRHRRLLRTRRERPRGYRAAEQRDEVPPVLTELHANPHDERGPHRRISNWQRSVSGYSSQPRRSQSRIDICHGGPQRSVTMNSAGRSIHSNMSVHEAV